MIQLCKSVMRLEYCMCFCHIKKKKKKHRIGEGSGKGNKDAQKHEMACGL